MRQRWNQQDHHIIIAFTNVNSRITISCHRLLISLGLFALFIFASTLCTASQGEVCMDVAIWVPNSKSEMETTLALGISILAMQFNTLSVCTVSCIHDERCRVTIKLPTPSDSSSAHA